jgi:asparagine N-glycosylation enzyme membrane subunit Stt3
MTAQDEATASGIMDVLDSKYVVIDIETAYGKFHTMVTWSGGNVSDYYEMLYRESNGELRTYNNPGSRSAEVQIFYPAYYQSMCARLYNFGAAAVVPNNSTVVVLFSEETDENGGKYKVIADVANDGDAFPNYDEARSFLDSHPGYIIVGLDPFSSPIPLEALTDYELIHSSPSIVAQRDNRALYYVEIFEYTGYKK